MYGDALICNEPTIRVNAEVKIAHPQLRDLIVCTERRGFVHYASESSIFQRDLFTPAPQPVSQTDFTPTCLSVSSTHSLLAAGGQKAEIYLHSTDPANTWTFTHNLLPPASINNSLFLNSMEMTDPSSTAEREPRLVVSNNDKTIKFFTIATGATSPSQERLEKAGQIELNTAVNHTSISPDGRTLVAVGDTPTVHLYHLNQRASVLAEPIATYPTSETHEALFSSAFSPCGRRFAVGSQDGAVSVWDVRSSRRLAYFRTLPRPYRSPFVPREWDEECMGKCWGVRNVKFSPTQGGARELLVFTEHMEKFHVVDARTFDEDSHRSISIPAPSSPPSAASSPRIAMRRADSDCALPETQEEPSRHSHTHSALIPPSTHGPIRSRLYSPSGEHLPRQLTLTQILPSSALSASRMLQIRRESQSSLFGMQPSWEEQWHRSAPTGNPQPPQSAERPHPSFLEDLIDSRLSPLPPLPPIPLHRSQPREPEMDLDLDESQSGVDPHKNISGLSFAPDGGHLYVGTMSGIMEWEIDLGRKRWFFEDIDETMR